MKAGKISYAGIGVTVGGVIGFLGVLVGWFKSRSRSAAARPR